MAKKDKKKGKQQDDYWDTEVQEDAAAVAAAPAAEEIPTNGTPDPIDDLADEFGGLMSAIKKTKGKKGKKQQVEMVDANEELEALEADKPAETNGTATAAAVDDDGEPEGNEFRVKTKKEKEKEKKEKEKAKKKAQADKKKAAAVPTPIAAPEPAAPEPVAEDVNDAEEDEGQDDAPGSKNKKKKKKAAAKKEEPAPAVAAPKRKGPNISALQKRLAAQQAAEEARRIAEEEEKRRIEEEERRAAEEEARKEEEKRLKKEKEKAKREELKKKGLLLSKKQKEQQRLAALRHEQLLAAGNVSVAGLSGGSADGQKAKRPVYGNKRKGKKEQEKQAEEAVVAEETPAPVKSVAEKPKTVEPIKQETKVKSDPAVVDSWEEAAADSWEDNIDEDGNIIEKPVQEKSEDVNGEEEEEEEEDEEESEEESEEDSEDDTESEEEPRQTAVQKLAAQKKAEASQRREEQHKEALAARSKDNLRSPICCILGHVDTGKTKLLDKIRQTNVQEGEAGGITQQIGATYFPLDAIKVKTAPVNRDNSFDFKIPGLLIIDTPGHESFTNLRSRGSSLCNIAILVIDIMHGLEPQTLESIRLLRDRKTPFIVALNKIDRIYGWEATPNGAFRESLAKQNRAAQSEFKDRCDRAILALQEQGLNSVLYYENRNFAKYVSIVPTSAHTGEGIPDMLMLLVKLTQERMTEKLMYLSELECTVLEVKVIEGLGTTIDVILSNGVLHEGDRIVLCGLNGAITTNIRALLTPEPMKEMRVKSAYVHHKEVKAALGVKITAQDLGNAIAGSRLLVCGPDDDEEDLAEEVMGDLQGLLNRIDKSGKGVCVQASTLGSLEALLEFLKTSKIPVSGINIGPVHKKDIMRCATMLERAPEFAVLLCFDVKVDREAEEVATEMGVKIFSANIIYHLFDSFTAYQKELMELKRKEASGSAVFPCVLRIIQVFRSRDPIVLGVDVVEGSIRIGTPITAVKVNETTKERTIYSLGKMCAPRSSRSDRSSSIEQNHKSVDIVKKGQAGAGVAIKIEGATQQLFGRHIDEKETLYSHITRHSIDTLKSPAIREEVTKEEWALIVKLKGVFGI